jgi:hypothetical protein
LKDIAGFLILPDHKLLLIFQTLKFISKREDLMVEVVDLESDLAVSLLFIVQVIFHIHVHLVHIVISLQKVIGFSGLLHEMGVLSLEITFFTIETFEFLMYSVQATKKTGVILLEVLNVLFDMVRHRA